MPQTVFERALFPDLAAQCLVADDDTQFGGLDFVQCFRRERLDGLVDQSELLCFLDGDVVAKPTRNLAQPQPERIIQLRRADIPVADRYDGAARRAAPENIADTPNRKAGDQNDKKPLEIPGLNALPQGFEHTRFP